MKYKVLLIFAALTFFVGCDDLLETTPGDSATDATIPDSVADLDLMVKGIYPGYPGRPLIQASSMISDDVRIAPTNTGQSAFLYNWSYTSTTGTFEAIWDNAYVSINRANRVILSYESVTPRDSELDLYNQYVAEAYGMRALSHLILLQTFSKQYGASNEGVPFVTSIAIEQQPARDTAGDVVAAIKSDIETAMGLMPTTFTDRTRLNYYALRTLKAKVAMWEGDYATAIQEATEVLNVYSITPSANFANLWNDSDDTEVVFEIGKDANNGGDGASGDLGGLFTRSSNGDIFFNPSDELVGLYDNNDIRKATYFSGTGTTAQVVKYPGHDGQVGLADIKVYRASEILLMRAFAYAKQGNLSAASADYNTLRNNRIAGNVEVNFGNSQNAIEAINLERRREMPYEGYRIYDAKAQGEIFTRLPEDCINVIVCELNDEYRYTYPIPQPEIFANDNMTQNPGYNN